MHITSEPMRRIPNILLMFALIGMLSVIAIAIAMLIPKPRLQVPATISSGLIFGDSWTVGYAAPEGEGYANLVGRSMGWDVTIEGSPGTGYLNRGPDGVGAYQERIALLPATAPDLILLQGGINDAWQDRANLQSAAKEAILAMKARFPESTLVVLGPAPAVWPVGERLEDVDYQLREAALETLVIYISPIEEDWFTATNIDEMIDANAANHPSQSGHRYFAERLQNSLKALQTGD